MQRGLPGKAPWEGCRRSPFSAGPCDPPTCRTRPVPRPSSAMTAFATPALSFLRTWLIKANVVMHVSPPTHAAHETFAHCSAQMHQRHKDSKIVGDKCCAPSSQRSGPSTNPQASLPRRGSRACPHSPTCWRRHCLCPTDAPATCAPVMYAPVMPDLPQMCPSCAPHAPHQSYSHWPQECR
jgi:hypothetical protein